MRKLFLILSGSVLIFLIQSCTTSGETSQFVLTVNVAAGVSGTPASGTYNYGENDVVSYNYTLQSGYTNLTVLLDGVAVGAAGTVNMNANRTLVVSAEQVDIRGMWSGLFYWTGSSTYFEVTFTGGILSGDTEGLFDWTPGYGHGHYTVNGDQVDFTLDYYICSTGEGMSCTGILTDNNHMSGTWDWDCNGIIRNETWTLER
jgi:hypothetical protein